MKQFTKLDRLELDSIFNFEKLSVIAINKVRHSNKLKKRFTFYKGQVRYDGQRGNIDVKIIQRLWIYEIHHFQLKLVLVYHNDLKMIAIEYFLSTFAILDTKIEITRYPVIVTI